VKNAKMSGFADSCICAWRNSVMNRYHCLLIWAHSSNSVIASLSPLTVFSQSGQEQFFDTF